MIVQELLRKTSFESIWSVLHKAHYWSLSEWQVRELVDRGISHDEWLEHLRASYECMIGELRELPSALPKDEGLLVAYPPFVWTGEDEAAEGELDVSLVFSGEHECYGLTGTPWEELVSYEVYGKSLEVFGETAVAANLLYEMAFCGFTAAQAKETAAELDRRLEEYERYFAEGHVVTLEELYEQGVFERPTEEEERQREQERQADALRYEEYRTKLEEFLSEL